MRVKLGELRRLVRSLVLEGTQEDQQKGQEEEWEKLKSSDLNTPTIDSRIKNGLSSPTNYIDQRGQHIFHGAVVISSERDIEPYLAKLQDGPKYSTFVDQLRSMWLKHDALKDRVRSAIRGYYKVQRQARLTGLSAEEHNAKALEHEQRTLFRLAPGIVKSAIEFADQMKELIANAPKEIDTLGGLKQREDYAVVGCDSDFLEQWLIDEGPPAAIAQVDIMIQRSHCILERAVETLWFVTFDEKINVTWNDHDFDVSYNDTIRAGGLNPYFE